MIKFTEYSKHGVARNIFSQFKTQFRRQNRRTQLLFIPYHVDSILLSIIGIWLEKSFAFWMMVVFDTGNPNKENYQII